MSSELSLIIAIIGFIVSILTIVSFILTRKEKGEKRGENEGYWHGGIENDIKYIKSTQTDIVVGQKEILNKLDNTNERVTRLEEQVKVCKEDITRLENTKADRRKKGE